MCLAASGIQLEPDVPVIKLIGLVKLLAALAVSGILCYIVVHGIPDECALP